jgi:hypothetical protein
MLPLQALNNEETINKKETINDIGITRRMLDACCRCRH